MPLQLLPDATIARPSRRDFLASLALGGVVTSLGAAPGPEIGEGGWYAFVSDTHIAADPSARSRGQVMADNLRAVVADILAAGNPPLGVFIDGDLALLDGRAGDYRTFVSILDPLRRNAIPLHLALGNHDDRAIFGEVLRGSIPAETRVVDRQVAVIDHPALRFVVLDSLDKVNAAPGLLGPVQLDWLARDLDSHSGAPTLILVHHNPTGEKPGLVDTRPLMDAIRPRRQVKALVFGHTHKWDIRQVDEIHLVNLPAVAYPFAPDQPLGWCRFRPGVEGGELELRCIGGVRRDDRQRVALAWRRG